MSMKNNNEKIDARLVIVGGGGAGLAAAVAAAETGVKDIVVLEKNRVLGGNSKLAGAIFACESSIQKQENVWADRDEFFKIAMKWAHWDRVEPLVLRAFINKSGDTISWLQKKGLEINLGKSLYPNQLRVMHFATGAGAQVVKTLAKICETNGIKVLTGTGAKKIQRRANGDIIGVNALNDEGVEFQIKTKSIIIASGGFGGNKTLLKKHCPSYYDGMRLVGLPHTGDGILMAEEVEASIADDIPLLKEGPNPDSKENITLKFLVKEPGTIWVNKKGKRFIDETAGDSTFESGNAILRQPDRVMYTLIDSTIMQDWTENSVPIMIGNSPRGMLTRDGKSMPDLANDFKRYQEKFGVVKMSDSWKEIADWIGAEPSVLEKTIEKYNISCNRGYDEDFGKARKNLRPLNKPPYYAIRSATYFLDTLGGIKVNENMEVLDRKSEIIPGLYAAGVIADGFESETYCSDLLGSALGFALNSGRIAGENAYKFIQTDTR
jgi:fumarate reductase flavoprotein subunit